MKRFHINLCTPDDLKNIIECQNSTVHALAHTNFYFPSTVDDLIPLFQNTISSGFIVGAFNEEQKLVGFASVAKWFDTYYGYPCDMEHQFYSIEDTVVEEKYRGNGVQTKLWRYVFSLLPKDAILLCTIHPDNTVSLRNAQALGFIPIMLTQVFGGMPRLILKRDGVLNSKPFLPIDTFL